MENKNFINQSLWAGSSPNQTGETQSRENRIGVFSYFYRTFVLLFMLLTIGVGQIWADDHMATGQVFYFKPSSLWITDARFAVCFQWVNGQQNDSWYSLISAGETDVYYAVAPGEYYDMYFCRMKGSDAENKWDNKWNQSTKLQWQEANKYNYFQQVTVDDSGWKESTTWTRYAPKMQSASIADNGTDILAGDGSEEDPYLVATGATIKVSASATSCVEADGDQTKRYTFQKADYSGEFVSMQDGTSTTYQIDASSTANTIHKFKVSAYNRYSKYTESNIDGTAAASSTIYYKTVSVKDITVYIYVGGCTDDQINSLVLTGTPYVGSKALSGVNINTPAGWTTDGNWRSYTFSNVTKVHTMKVAGMDGAIPLKNIEDATEDFYYRMFDGTELDYKCVSAPSLTWGTEPADGYVDENMTAVVNTTPVSGGSPSVTWSTSNSNIAAVNKSTGEISYKAAGSATITAHVTWSETGDYCAGSYDLEQTITVSAPSQEAELGSITLDPSGTQNYAGSPIDFELKVTSTYLPNPVVIFYVTDNSNSTTYEVVATTGAIGSSPNYETTHTATFSASNAATYSVTAKVFAGELIDNFVTNNKTYWYNLNGGSATRIHNDLTKRTASNGSSDYLEITCNTNNWHTAYTCNTADNTEGATSWGKNYNYFYISMYAPQAESSTKVKYRDHTEAAGSALSANTWQRIKFTRTEGNIDYIMPFVESAGNNSIYIDDIILSNEETMTEKATAAEPASFSINWNYTVTLNNNDATTPGTESVNVTYGSALSNIAVPSKTDYTFYGYYTENAGEGRQLIDAAGVWIASVDGYTDENKNWVHGDDVTLYAKWGKNPSLTRLDLSTSVVTTGNTFTATPTIDAGDGRTTNVCWAVKNSSDEEVSTTITPIGGNAVTITAPDAPGKYKVVATLREGNDCGGTVLNSLQQPFTVEGHYTVTITNGTGSENVGEETTATVTADPAEAGMKFDRWTVKGTYTLQGGTSLTSREIQFTASTNISITAVYTDRDSKTVYFAKPADWDHVYAYAWNGGTNNKWPGVQLDGSVAGTGTVTVNCATYYYYKFYTDAGSDDAVATVPAAVWTNVIFNSGVASGSAVANKTKTRDLTIVNGNYYGIHTGMQNTSASGYSTSAKWTLRGSFNGWSEKTYPFSCDDDAHTYSVSVTGLTASTSYDFKIWGPDGVAYKYTDGKNATYNDPYDITSLLDGRDLILNEYSSQNNTFTAATTSYTFTIDVTDPKHPVLTVISGDEANYSATLQAGAHGDVTNAGAVTLHRYATTSITATPEPGYRFLNWTSTGGGTVEFGNANNATTTVTATADGATITANFTNEGIIYLDKSAISSKWSGTPYVYFYSGEYWNNVSGSGSQTSPSEGVPGTCISASNAMTRIGESQIWYYDYSALLSAGTSKQYIAFVDKSNQTGKNWFDACSVIYRGDFYPGASMFVVRDYTVYKNKHDNVQTAYYNEGYWRKYNDTDPGYVLKIYNGTGGGSTQIGYAKFASEEPGNNTCTAKIHLSSDPKGFKVEGCDTTTINGVRYAGTWYSNSGKMTSANSSNWEFVTSVSNNCGITPTAEGDYIFTLSLADGRLYVSVEYPLANGDYRIVYNGKVKTTGDATHHPSNFIRNTSNGGVGKDTVSFFVTDDGEGDPDWSLTLQQCTNASANPVQWANACDAGHTLTASDLDLSGKTGVYVFEIEQNSSGSCSGVTIRNLGEYTGNYYIRTDVADGGWEAYETVPDNKMIFSEYARDHSGFDYYHCHWTPTNTNVKFTIANDYSACITDTVENDTYVTEYGKLPYQANIRFMYNSAKNTISRAYLNGSSETGENTFLYLQSTSNALEPDIYQSDGSALVDNTIRFNDHNNWIYQIDIQANEQARVKLISNYRFNGIDHLQYFKGTDGDWSEATTSEIIGGDYSSHPNERHDLRIIYDFKTNHLLSAWLVPGSGSVHEAAINTNVMIIKQNQEDARQITFSSGNALTEVDTVYTAVLLTKEFLTDGVASEYAKQFYWVSFPYTVQINDIFGSVGTYGYDWILQRYNGKKRAANGFWIDSEPNWEFMDKSETLNPYEGYILTLDLSEFTSGSLKWNNNVTYLSLYFPSDSKVGNISQKTVTVEYDQTGYACTITRDNRNIKDSYWRCIGSPSFAENTIGGWNRHENTDDTWKTEKLPFLYEWNSETNQLSPVAAGENYTFKPLTGYMVQYSGTSIEWANVVTPSVSAPKRQNSAATDLTYKLQLVRGEEEVDHTFVRFSDDENITAAFEFNQDLCKEYKSGGNIYTITSDAIQVAGNSLPLSTTQTTVVPIGVKIKTAGDYTFSIPEGTEGIGITLVDNETGVRTLLSALDYTVNLTAGTHDGRFVLEISPIQNTPTDIENVQGDDVQCTKVRKVMIDGILYIVKDGKIFDARGARVE